MRSIKEVKDIIECARCGDDTTVIMVMKRKRKGKDHHQKQEYFKVTYIYPSRYKNPEGKTLCRRCYSRMKTRAYRVKLMGQVLSEDGIVKCVHCGYDKDIRALQIDHKSGGGKAEQLKHGNCHLMYMYYLKHIEEAKEKLQILCCNCNRIKMQTMNEFGNLKKRKKKITS